MKPQQAAEALRKKARNLRREVLNAENKNLDIALEVARSLSSGPFSSAALAALGHPYAKGDPNPPADTAIINAQSETGLRENWQKQPVTYRAGKFSGKIYNTSPHAKYFDEKQYPEGTRSMVARPVQKRIREKIQKRRMLRLRQAIKRALKGT